MVSTNPQNTQTCDHCGLSYRGAGYSPDADRHFCCYGCYLVTRILGHAGEESMPMWLILRLGIGAFLSMNVMMVSMVLYVNSSLSAPTIRAMHWALLLMATPAMFILCGSYIYAGVKELRRGRAGMDALIASGSVAAYVVSVMHVVGGKGFIYFDTATMLPLVMTVGRLLEANAKSNASKAVKQVMELVPRIASVIRNGEEMEIDSADVEIGDTVVVRPGARIPVDGRITKGRSMVEESAFTGEPASRSCAPGSFVFGGSLACDGFITLTAESTEAESLASRIKQMVNQAQAASVPFQRLTERAASAFFPIVWCLAIGAGLYWGLLHHMPERAGLSALSVLVVACPCALAFAAPMSSTLAIGLAARAGVLIRSGEVIERLSKIGTMFIDKTGTLTSNELAVGEVRIVDGYSDADIFSLAATLEQGSEHSIARAILKAARLGSTSMGELTSINLIPGSGVEGVVSYAGTDHKVIVGSRELIAEKYLIPDSLNEFGEENASVVYVVCNGKTVAAITLRAEIRGDAKESIERLQGMGLRTIILSGDQKGPTLHLGQALGVEDCIFRCNPEKKLHAITKARKDYRQYVAMVGDGINDAPALAEADVGISVGSGTDLAHQSSDVILLGDDLLRLPWIFELSRATCKVIRQNLWWAFGYNSVALILAFLGYLHPLVAAIIMVISSLTIIGNCVRAFGGVSQASTFERFC